STPPSLPVGPGPHSLSLHDALPFLLSGLLRCAYCGATLFVNSYVYNGKRKLRYNCPSTYKSKQKTRTYKIMDPNCPFKLVYAKEDRKSTRLNSSHDSSSYAVFCLRK